ncbi:hypothetical protein BZA77DRAFT_5058 [Pyronema omphalodes]|nr:hypothetical protein BZA77DRAFT_5058 [Pyronema omphalodes]
MFHFCLLGSFFYIVFYFFTSLIDHHWGLDLQCFYFLIDFFISFLQGSLRTGIQAKLHGYNQVYGLLFWIFLQDISLRNWVGYMFFFCYCYILQLLLLYIYYIILLTYY